MSTSAVPAIESIYHREHEVIVKVTRFEPWERCQHGKQIVHALAHWSDDAPFTVTTGQINHTQRFEVTRHADGTAVIIDEPWGPQLEWEHNQVHKCAKCDELDTLSTVQEAYGDRTTCLACGDSNWYSIGD